MKTVHPKIKELDQKVKNEHWFNMIGLIQRPHNQIKIYIPSAIFTRNIFDPPASCLVVNVKVNE